MPALPGESLRAQARREGITPYQARISRAESRGISKAVAAGKASRTGERGLAPPKRVRDELRDVDDIKHKDIGNGRILTIQYDEYGDQDIVIYDDDYWTELYAWLDYLDIDHEDYGEA